MPPGGSPGREQQGQARVGQEKSEVPVKQERKIKLEIIDLEEDVEEVPAAAAPAPVPSAKAARAARAAKAEEAAKRELKAEPREERRAKEKKAKVKRERKDDDEAARNRDGHKDKDGRRRRPSRSRSASRRRKRRSRSPSSSSSSSSSSSESALYRRFRPYTKVQLVNLVRKAELNGMTGQVVHPSTSVSPCPPGCVLVRLETGREIAVKPPNITALKAFHVGPQQAPQSQEKRLQQVLAQIKMNVDNVMERTMAIRDTDGSGMLLDNPEAVQGGIGHML